ncbi:hypothetical protein KOAAANKH_00107 [Brevundimonas sp. NIBR10]|uniref:hypothetical protein n=1 Tax=Brevundimonas sp. NIBR10 TaxID=3015997 RepID=UPI0022F15EDC|nr:hypothetical protein [Brevundimonas sp. NIBR10]WGM45246.1 hypothetical protein KOAAANKH_00107 [Brevundimonas sp. NIBR10]
MALSTEDAARLARLRADRASALDPNRAIKIAQAGRSIEKAVPDLKRIDAEIAALEAASLTPSGRVRKRGAITFRFR